MSQRSRKRSERNAPYRSGFEADMAEFLSKRGIKFEYESHKVKYTAPVQSGVCLDCTSKRVGKVRRYTPDFTVGTIILETKGKLTSSERTKFIAIKKSNPGIDLRLVFQRDNKLRRDSTQHYSDWASANGFKYIIGVKLPAKWVRELRQQPIRQQHAGLKEPEWEGEPKARSGKTNGDPPS